MASSGRFSLPVLCVLLASLSSLFSFHLMELILAAVFSCFLGVATLRAVLVRRRILFQQPEASLLILCGVYVVIYFAAPRGFAGGGFLTERLVLFPFFALLLWLSTQPFGSLMRRALQIAPIVVASLLLLSHFVTYAKLNRLIQEYTSAADHLESDATLLPVSFSPFGYDHQRDRLLSRRVAPFLNAAGYLAADRGVVQLCNYEAWTGYFPVIFRADVDPSNYMQADHYYADVMDIVGYEQQTPGRVDYILVWDYAPDYASRDRSRFRRLPCCDDDDVQRLLRQLRTRYRLVYQSPGTGAAAVYRRESTDSRALHQSQ
jgi:hypothetical protein